MFETFQEIDLHGEAAANYYDAIASNFHRTREDVPGVSGTRARTIYRRCWEGLTAYLLEFVPEGALELSVGGDVPMFAVVTDQVSGRLTIDGVVSQTDQGLPLGLATTAGRSLRLFGEDIALLRMVVIAIDDAASKDVPPRTGSWTLSAETLHLIPSIEEAFRRDEEDIASSLKEVISRLRMASSRPGLRGLGGLAAWQLNKVERYVRDNLSRTLPLRELAGEVRLSQSHFCRAFKVSKGIAPHRWIMMARCQRAKELLMDGKRGLVEIALEVGFGDQSHFTRAFGRVVGSRPGAWRRERAGG